MFSIALNDMQSVREGCFVEILKSFADTYILCKNISCFQVALTKIAFVNTLINIHRDSEFFTYASAESTDTKYATVPSGHYKDMTKLISALNAALPDAARRDINFELNTLTGEVTVNCKNGAAVQLSTALKKLFKIDLEVIESRTISNSYVDINYQNRCLKLHTNLVYSSLTNGSSCERLLANVPIIAEFGGLIVYEPKNLHFRDVALDELHVLEFELVDLYYLPAEINSIASLELCFRDSRIA